MLGGRAGATAPSWWTALEGARGGGGRTEEGGRLEILGPWRTSMGMITGKLSALAGHGRRLDMLDTWVFSSRSAGRQRHRHGCRWHLAGQADPQAASPPQAPGVAPPSRCPASASAPGRKKLEIGCPPRDCLPATSAGFHQGFSGASFDPGEHLVLQAAQAEKVGGRIGSGVVGCQKPAFPDGLQHRAAFQQADRQGLPGARLGGRHGP